MYLSFMGRKHKHLKLTEAQKSALEKGYRQGSSHHFRLRCHCLLLNSEGKTIEELSKLAKVNRNTISIWFSRYNAAGIEGLQIKSGRGRKPKLDIDNTQQVQQVQKSLAKENRSLHQLRQDLEKQINGTLSDSTLRRFLKDLTTDTADSENASNPSRIQGRWMKK